jgi:predicted permease
MLHDLKHAYRMLLQTKGWTLVVLLSLAIGIGATTALFTAVNGLLLQTLAVPEPGTLVRLSAAGENNMRRSSSDYGFAEPHQGVAVRSSFSFAGYEAMRAANETLSDLTGFAPGESANVIVNSVAELASVFVVTGNFFTVIKPPVTLGRPLAEEDDRAGAPLVAVISNALWRRRFGSDPNAVGMSVRMNNTPVTIVGVTGPQYGGVLRLAGPAPEVTITTAADMILNPTQAKRYQEPTTWWMLVMGRLRPNATLPQVAGNLEGPFHASARGGMDLYMKALKPEERGLSNNQRRGTAVPTLVARSGDHGIYDADTNSKRSATIVSVVVTILLLIVCANVANLLLSRGTVRSRELAVRLSMGAPRRRLIRQLLTESLLLSGVGGLLGVGVAYWGKSLLPFGQNASIDARVVGFVAGISVLTGLLFGVVPAIRATGVDLAGTMKESSRSVTGGRTWLSKGLLVLQVAMSLVLLIGAGLFLRTLNNLRSVDVGFNANNLLMFRINPLANRYDTDRIPQLRTRTKDTLAALPGVQSVAFTRMALLSGGQNITGMYVPGKTEPHEIHAMQVSPEFFATLNIPVLLGRGFTEQDLNTPDEVALINETAAKQLFAGTNPIGQRFGSSIEGSSKSEIVGVIKDTKYHSLREPAPPTLYRVLPYNTGPFAVVLRTAGSPMSMIDSVRNAMRQVDPDLPITGVTTQTDQIENRVAQERLFALAYSLFGGLALLLACIGLFGLMSYTVSRRTSEIGIRIALGAQRAGVVGMVLRESMIMVVIGVVVGLAAAIAAGRLVTAVLFGLAANDVWTITAAIALMTVVCVIAGYLPARRASRIDPMVALRYE